MGEGFLLIECLFEYVYIHNLPQFFDHLFSQINIFPLGKLYCNIL